MKEEARGITIIVLSGVDGSAGEEEGGGGGEMIIMRLVQVPMGMIQTTGMTTGRGLVI